MNMKENSITNDEKYVVKVKSLCKTYSSRSKEYVALANINLEIMQGEFIAIVGKSGSGKSTLLNIFGGIDNPTSGEILVNNKKISNLNENELSKFRGKNIGFIFQFFQLMPTLTVFENILMPMDFLSEIPLKKRKERAEELLSKVNMLNHANKFPSELSGGEQQRVAIARALANNPDIILADEPTGNLDTKTTESIFSLLESLTKEGKTVIMVTHNDELAARCKRIIKIQDGLIIQDNKNY